MDTSISLEKYMEGIASSAPTPGGGNVSAMSGALACALGVMICNLTIGKKKYAEVESDMISLKEKIESARQQFIELSKKDNEAFDKVMDAFKLPKESEEDKKERNRKIEETTIEAGRVPSQVVELSKVTSVYLIDASAKGNQNSLSDAGVALSLLITAAKGAYLNVLINCSPIQENLTARELLISAGNDFNETEALCKNKIGDIEKRLGK